MCEIYGPSYDYEISGQPPVVEVQYALLDSMKVSYIEVRVIYIEVRVICSSRRMPQAR